MTTTTPVTQARPTPADRRRQVAVVGAEVFCVIGTLVGIGVLGTRVEESSGGALAATATLLAPAGPAFAVWTPIYLGLAAFTVWQALPAKATHPMSRATGWPAAASMVLNAAWLLVTQQGWIWVSVGVIGLLAYVLGVLVARLDRRGPRTAAGGMASRGVPWAERAVLDWTFGAYLGWVAVATCANVTAAFVDSGADLGSVGNQAAAVVVLVVAAGLGALFARRFGGRLAVALAMAWGLAWIAVGRLGDEPRSTVTGVVAGVAAVAVLVAALAARRSLAGARPVPR